MALDVAQLGFPAAAVHAEGFDAAMRWHFVEAGYGLDALDDDIEDDVLAAAAAATRANAAR